MTFLANFEALTFPHSLGGTFDREPRGVCWHRTEGGNIGGAIGVYKSKLACPHMTVDMDTQEKVQHVPLDRSAYALQRGDDNHVCHVQTNRSGIVQIEVVGFSADSWTVSPHQLEWLGTEVLKPIFEACPTIPRGPVYSGPRMNEAEWDIWSGGQCGHRDVCCQPDGHTDPGDLNLTQIVAYATGEDMALSDDDIKKIVEAVMARPLDIEGYRAPFAEWIGYLYAEVTRDDKLTKRVADAVAKHALIVDEGH